ncbi:MAG: single-stranded DNA-binding protein [Candidatus Nephthysia bennettiae]|uniref:Single-stranded DNA-binding protein n=1 Tax=Candidatus Nephthysia bennettiae TaxID=3127016 RepID=A0A934K723_9BACT|nr:single-stranded DNA-binding protein [Candidatus Dormibacteraeota bacterium]MBJ7612858.1 single-stranded DNA-binding protein [Candidatus Dormibacteraeota bacterium]PZR97291.1 MAG: single-stranded DNA-binding protein [Candidatus Dormibacteraeota bacterium]
MVNRVTLLGRLTADPELRTTPSGTQVANLRLATNEYAGKDESGVRREHTEFHTLVLFGRQAEVAGSYLRKGGLLYADGHLRSRSWDGSDGNKRHATEIVLDSFQMLSGKPDGEE